MSIIAEKNKVDKYKDEISLLEKIYPVYEKSGGKIILLIGYNDHYQQLAEAKAKEKGQKFDAYAAAKHPIPNQTGFTKDDFKSASLETVSNHIKSGGWLGFVLPPGFVALDIDKDQHSIKQAFEIVDYLYTNRNLPKPNITETKNGFHLYYKDNSGIKGATKAFTKAGFELTYRGGQANYLVAPPSDGRKWIINLVDFQSLPELPEAFQRLDTKNATLEDLTRAVASQFKYCYKNKFLSGNDHIDMAFMGWLVKTLRYDLKKVENIFKMIYGREYDENKTITNFERAIELPEATGFATLKEAIDKVEGLGYFINLLNMFGKAHKFYTNSNIEIPEEQIKLNILGHSSMNVLVWAAGDIYELKHTDLNPSNYQLLTGIKVEPKEWLKYKDNIISIAHKKGRINKNEKIKKGIWKFGNVFYIISGLNVIKIEGGAITTINKPLISDADGDNILLSLNKGDAWLDINHFKKTFEQDTDGPTQLKESFGKIYNIVKQWCWKTPEMAAYATAAVMLTPLQHAMKWRPLLFLTGERDSGKTYFHENIPAGLYSNLVKRLDKTTPHSIIQIFGDTSKFMILDEFEKYTYTHKILELLKSCGYGGTKSSGTPGPGALQYKLHHMAWLSSTQDNFNDAAQASRFVKFELAKPEKRTPPTLPDDDEMKKIGAEIIAALIKAWPILEEHYDYYAKNASNFKCDNRMVRNIAYMVGILNIYNNDAKEDIKGFPEFLCETIKEDRDTILENILDSHITNPCAEKYDLIPVREALLLPSKNSDILGPKYGIRLYGDRKGQQWLVIWPDTVQRHVLKDIPAYKDGLIKIKPSLLRIPGAKEDKIRPKKGISPLACIKIPLEKAGIDLSNDYEEPDEEKDEETPPF